MIRVAEPHQGREQDSIVKLFCRTTHDLAEQHTVGEDRHVSAVLLQGGLVGFSGGGVDLLSDMRALEPTAVGSVPRLFEVVHAALEVCST